MRRAWEAYLEWACAPLRKEGLLAADLVGNFEVFAKVFYSFWESYVGITTANFGPFIHRWSLDRFLGIHKHQTLPARALHTLIFCDRFVPPMST